MVVFSILCACFFKKKERKRRTKNGLEVEREMVIDGLIC
jgi:hypothetical protein